MTAVRIFALSDLHVDNLPNRKWVEQLSRQDYREDLLIIAGDVSDDLTMLERIFRQLRERFARLAFVPGNHELWIRQNRFTHSLEKWERVQEVCQQNGVLVKPFKIGEGDSHPVWVVPLFSWYIRPEEGEGSLFLPKPGEDQSLRMWADNYYIRWPFAGNGAEAARYFLRMNETTLKQSYDAPVISFSHFLPRQELMFPPNFDPTEARKRDRYPSFNFSRVAGCIQLERQIRLLGSLVHIYGHQHRNRHRLLEGVHYLSHCLGYPAERENGQIEGIEQGPRLVWDTSRGFAAL